MLAPTPVSCYGPRMDESAKPILWWETCPHAACRDHPQFGSPNLRILHLISRHDAVMPDGPRPGPLTDAGTCDDPTCEECGNGC